MTPSQQVREFCKRNSMEVSSKDGVVMISKRIVNDSWYIELFDNYSQAVEFIAKAQNDFINKSKELPWSKCQMKFLWF